MCAPSAHIPCFRRAFWDRDPLLAVIAIAVVVLPALPWTIARADLDDNGKSGLVAALVVYYLMALVPWAIVNGDTHPRDLAALARQAACMLCAALVFHAVGAGALWLRADSGRRFATEPNAVTLLVGVPVMLALLALAASCHWLWRVPPSPPHYETVALPGPAEPRKIIS